MSPQTEIDTRAQGKRVCAARPSPSKSTIQRKIFCFSFSFLAARLARPLRFDFSPFFLLSGDPGGLFAFDGGLGGLFGALGGDLGACLGEAVFGLPGGLLSTMALMVRGARRQVCGLARYSGGRARCACPLVALV